MNLHVFSLCEHRAGAPSDDGLNTVRLEGTPPASADVSDDTPGHSLGRISDRRRGDSGDRWHGHPSGYQAAPLPLIEIAEYDERVHQDTARHIMPT